jgi:hypothetical protein
MYEKSDLEYMERHRNEMEQYLLARLRSPVIPVVFPGGGAAADVGTPAVTTLPRSPPSSGNDERTFYRSLDQNLTQLDFSVRVLAAYQLTKNTNLNNPLRRVEINKVESDAKAVCEARPKVSELGDMAILEQLNKVCAVFQIGEEYANFTGGFSAVIAAQFVAEKGLLQQLRNDVAPKAR